MLISIVFGKITVLAMKIALKRYADSRVVQDNGKRTVNSHGVILAFSRRELSRIYASATRRNADDFSGAYSKTAWRIFLNQMDARAGQSDLRFPAAAGPTEMRGSPDFHHEAAIAAREYTHLALLQATPVCTMPSYPQMQRSCVRDLPGSCLGARPWPSRNRLLVEQETHSVCVMNR